MKSLVLIMATVPMMASYCNDNGNSNVGYHYILLPDFEVSDYLKMLDSKTEELQYNAICYFSEIGGYPRTLETDTLKGTGKYDTALLIYHAIYPKIASPNDWVSSAAIRFVNGFKYNRTAFINAVTLLNTPSRNIQLEIINALKDDTLANGESLYGKYRFLKTQPSWLLQTSAYTIGYSLSDEHINQLITAYKKSREQYEKSLIILALRHNVTDQAFDFMTREWATTNNKVLKTRLFETFTEAKNPDRVMQWFNKHDTALIGGISNIISNLDYKEKNDIHVNLLLMAIEKGWKATELMTTIEDDSLSEIPTIFFTQLLYRYGDNFKETEDTIILNNCLKIEKALFKNPIVKQAWMDMVDKLWEYPLPLELIERNNALTKDYLQKTKALFQEFGIDTSVYMPYIKETISSSDDLGKSKTRMKN